jgi:crotonyl-CoA carboxylase/reductase
VTSADLVDVGTLPPVGELPRRMWAQAVRQADLGAPAKAFKRLTVDVPTPGPSEVLVAVMAAGINFNNVWAAQGIPIDVIAVRQRAGEPYDFHIGGSDASGIVYAVGSDVTRVSVGDEVVLHPGYWDVDDPFIRAGGDPMVAPSARIWGYDTNFGSFGQFCVAQEHQCMPKAPGLTWEEAAAPTLVGATAYRMLFGWSGNKCGRGDLVLVWGGAGGLGTQAIQLAKHAGATVAAVVSDEARGEYCMRLGASGYINRREFDHWGIPPHWTDTEGQKAWMSGARAFGRALEAILGDRAGPHIVFEHPGETTIPTSMYVCRPGGMVVICAGTTGYSAVADLRYLWTRQKRLQGSHGANDEQAYAYNDLVGGGVIDPCVGEVVPFDDIGLVHQDMLDGRLGPGNAVALVGTPAVGLGRRTTA